MKLSQLVQTASDKTNFTKVSHYIAFCRKFLDFIGDGLQAVIVSQNECNYCFYQFRKDGHFNVTRPINTNLMLDAAEGHVVSRDFLKTLRSARELSEGDTAGRELICRAIYTIQQSIGAVLDALPAGESNKARKINGDLFERLIRLLVRELGVACRTGTVSVPVLVDGEEQCRMSFQHDLIMGREEQGPSAIGSVKTSSKDRLDKIFMDKFIYWRLTETRVPHFAIFLNDVQRKKTKREDRYGVNATFLPGHFRAYTVKLCALDGVFCCDIRPNMVSDPFLRTHIRTIDRFFCEDLWQLQSE